MPMFAMQVDALGSLRWPKMCAVCGEASTTSAVVSAATKDFGVFDRDIDLGFVVIGQWRIYVHYPICQRHRFRCKLVRRRPNSRFRLCDAIVTVPFYAFIALICAVISGAILSGLFAVAGLHELASLVQISNVTPTFVGASIFTLATSLYLTKMFWAPVQVRELRHGFIRFTLVNRTFFNQTIALNREVSL